MWWRTDPFVAEQEVHAGGAETVSLQDLFAWSDFISLHLPFDVHSRLIDRWRCPR
jgi:phosphoglycerate dehydrogenase-like enzyme